MLVLSLLQFDVRVGGSNVLEKRRRIFADDGLGVIASNVVPFDAVLVDVIEHAQARFLGLVDFEFSVVGLRSLKMASSAPWLITPTGGSFVGLGQFDAGTRPEPSVDQDGLQIFTITAFEVAQTSARPNVG